jgi:hypothetical protein
MRDDEIDDVLHGTGDSSGMDPALLERVTNSLGPSLEPVRPLPPSGVLIASAAAVCLGISAAGAALFGFHGIGHMQAAQIRWVFPILALLVGVAAWVSVDEMIPGSGRRLRPGWMLIACCVALLLAFGLLFDDYYVERFWSQGVACLATGLLHAVPAAGLTWLVLRRGYAVHPVAAGLAQGTLAGLAGVAMLELHCANFEAPHILLWHIGVLPLSGAIAVLLVRARRTD